MTELNKTVEIVYLLNKKTAVKFVKCFILNTFAVSYNFHTYTVKHIHSNRHCTVLLTLLQS